MRPPDAQVLRAAVESPAQRPEDDAILSEILALRKIVINLLYDDKAGEPLSEDRMRELIEASGSGVAPQSSGTPRSRADSTSWSLAR